MSRANASKSGMGMWPRAYSLKSSLDALLADILCDGGGGGKGGGVVGEFLRHVVALLSFVPDLDKTWDAQNYVLK